MHHSKPDDCAATRQRDQEPKMSLLELIQNAMQGLYPGEQCLEHMLDRIEETP